MILFRLGIIAAPLLLCAPAGMANTWVEFGDPNPSCTSFDSSTKDTPILAEVNPPGGKRLNFIANKAKDDKCPSLEAQCQLPASLPSGERVVVTSSAGEFACVHTLPRAGAGMSGLVRASSLNIRGVVDAKLSGIGMGTWRSGAATIVVRKGGDRFIMIDAEVHRGPPSYSSNSISGPAFLSDNEKTAGFDDNRYNGDEPANEPARMAASNCRVRLRLVGTDLLAVDNSEGCGQLSFGGLYRKGR